MSTRVGSANACFEGFARASHNTNGSRRHCCRSGMRERKHARARVAHRRLIIYIYAARDRARECRAVQ